MDWMIYGSFPWRKEGGRKKANKSADAQAPPLNAWMLGCLELFCSEPSALRHEISSTMVHSYLIGTRSFIWYWCILIWSSIWLLYTTSSISQLLLHLYHVQTVLKVVHNPNIDHHPPPSPPPTSCLPCASGSTLTWSKSLHGLQLFINNQLLILPHACMVIFLRVLIFRPSSLKFPYVNI